MDEKENNRGYDMRLEEE